MKDYNAIDFYNYFKYDESSPSGLIHLPKNRYEFKHERDYVRFNKNFANKPAGCIITRKDGYQSWQVQIGDDKYTASRVVHVLVYGQIDNNLFIDHINGDSLDNKVLNFRLATSKQNQANSKTQRNSVSGIKGVSKINNNTWRAVIGSGEGKSLGYFNSPEEASAAYMKEAEKRYGDFARAQ